MAVLLFAACRRHIATPLEVWPSEPNVLLTDIFGARVFRADLLVIWFLVAMHGVYGNGAYFFAACSRRG
ncbi:hypothetical protein DY251_05670 [Mesorhizobium denitrificans]|uniref:Uncharacterized protein n=1 Tax=Mesorhizobium denitrificans TaxID=2294114 RepID=A0A371XGV3_9HYPH|nr:hypothetical protein DY251_05670 [Mesorhizobium denitrificans]